MNGTLILAELRMIRGTLFRFDRKWPPVWLPIIAVNLFGILWVLASSSHDLTGRQILSTDVIECTGKSGVIRWTNTTGDTIRIAKAQVWMGMYRGSLSDFAVWVQREERESTLMHSNWDHYRDPVAPDHYLETDYSPHHISLEQGERLALHYSCTNIDNSNAHGHATVTIWYYQ